MREIKITCGILLFIVASGIGLYGLCTAIQNRIGTNYETGVTITPNPEYRIELKYSPYEAGGVYTFPFKAKVLNGGKIIRGSFLVDKPMHLWTWRLLYEDEEVYKETIDRDVKTGDDIQFIYVVK